VKRWWRDLAVAKKLYVVVGLMAVLIATELMTLIFAMNILSSVRAFVVGEGLWSKAQKDAIQSVYQHALTGDRVHWDNFTEHLKIPMGDRKARLNLEKNPPDLKLAREGLLEGGNHPDDVNGMISLLQRFHWISFIETSVGAWRQADVLLERLIQAGNEVEKTVRLYGLNAKKLTPLLREVSEINSKLTEVENLFSNSLGEGSRWLENVLFILLTLTVLTVEGTGLYLTFRFSRQLGNSLRELMRVAKEVGHGNFAVRASVRSQDELGQLAGAVNKMAGDLKENIGGRQQAENASEIKSIFVANTSHEIRSPLGIILGFVEILKDPKLNSAERLKYLEIIEQTGHNLRRIIDDILDISKVETGHLDIELSTVDLEEFVAEIEELFRVRVAQRKNTIVFEREPMTPRHITTDRVRLNQVLVNLIGNANKFTNGGEILIQYGGVDGLLYFRVKDSGIGLDALQTAKLFQAFSQVDQSTNRRYGGTGLGLVLAKKIALVLGGDVVLERSVPGMGATFLATVRDQAEHKAPTVPAPVLDLELSRKKQSLKGRTVLVVDDSADNHMLLDALLGRLGMNVSSALNGDEALLKAAHEKFDLILMDIQMPVMDGYVTTSNLRMQDYKGPIVALTANAMKETKDQCLSAGCDDYLTKPVDMNLLMKTLERHICDDVS
jgi:signal transduction histidine kinase/CheY-like chemotaxis protein